MIKQRPNTPEQLFEAYIAVVNDMLRARRREPRYSELLSGASKVLGGKVVGVSLRTADPRASDPAFTLKLVRGRFRRIDQQCPPDVAWMLDEAHARDVVNDPQRYLRDPSRLDLEWLRVRVGVGVLG